MKKRETKLQVQSILATVVMGMNLVNTAAPAVAVAMTEQQQPAPKQAVSEAQQEEMQSYAYEVLPILAGYVDEIVFSKAEAAVVTVLVSARTEVLPVLMIMIVSMSPAVALVQ